MLVASCSTHASNAWWPRTGRRTASVRSCSGRAAMEVILGSGRRAVNDQRSEVRPILGRCIYGPLGAGLASEERLRSPEKVSHARSTRTDSRARCPSAQRGREAPGEARVQAGPEPVLVRFL